jgi:hypothetical protein
LSLPGGKAGDSGRAGFRRNHVGAGGGLEDGRAPGAAYGAGDGPAAAGKWRLCRRFPSPVFPRPQGPGGPGVGTDQAPGPGLREGGAGRDRLRVRLRLRLCGAWEPGRAELPGFAPEERGGDAWRLPEGGGGPSFVGCGFRVDCLGDSDGELSAPLRLAREKRGGAAPCGPPGFLARRRKLARPGGVNLWPAPGPPFFTPRGLEPALGNGGALLFVFGSGGLGSLADSPVSTEGAGAKPALCGGPDFAGAFAAFGGHLGGAGPERPRRRCSARAPAGPEGRVRVSVASSTWGATPGFPPPCGSGPGRDAQSPCAGRTSSRWGAGGRPASGGSRPRRPRNSGLHSAAPSPGGGRRTWKGALRRLPPDGLAAPPGVRAGPGSLPGPFLPVPPPRRPGAGTRYPAPGRRRPGGN